MTVNLDPCPFCGGQAILERAGNRRQSTLYACQICGCRLETAEEWGHGRRWNDRVANAQARREALKEAGWGVNTALRKKPQWDEARLAAVAAISALLGDAANQNGGDEG